MPPADTNLDPWVVQMVLKWRIVQRDIRRTPLWLKLVVTFVLFVYFIHSFEVNDEERRWRAANDICGWSIKW